MPTTLTLSQMLDMALGTPEVGAVNFNVMHTLLHTMLQNLNIANVQALLPDEDREALNQPEATDKTADEKTDSTEIKSNQIKSTETKSNQIKSTETKPSRPNSRNSSPLKPVRSTPPYDQLQDIEDKVAKLEEQLHTLNELPSNTDLFSSPTGVGEKPRAVADMWQNMQLARKVATNEEGIGKLMSMVEDMLAEMQKLGDTNEDLKKQQEDLASQLGNVPVPKDNSDLEKKLKELEDLTNKLNDQLSQYPSSEDFNDFVTWAGLEDSLKGIRQMIDDSNQPPTERVVIEMSVQTEVPSRPASSRNSTPGPSFELMQILEQLGKLNDKHDQIDERVVKLEEEMPLKADKSALESLSVPDDLLALLKELQDQMDNLKTENTKDRDALSRVQQSILQLQNEMERLSNTTQNMIDENNNKQQHIDSLYSLCEKIEQKKADKEFVHMEVDVKADKRHLDGKVNRSHFEHTCDELNKMINDILGKLTGNEDEWQKALALLSGDIDGKLDRMEFGPIREELERQLRALQRKFTTMNFVQQEEDEAAGFRKQLVQRYHCISCDRPIEMGPQGPIPSIPATQGLPTSRSARPYTTFELDQIRQQSRSLSQPPMDIIDAYAASRPCGGTHTLTYPNRRITRMTTLNSMFREDEVIPGGKEELDIQGADGHIYKGRVDTHLPAIGGTPMPKSPKMGNKHDLGQAGLMNHPVAPTSPRPYSARNARTPATMRSQGSRPQSAGEANGLTAVPTGQDMMAPPPPPAPSEPDPQSQPLD